MSRLATNIVKPEIYGNIIFSQQKQLQNESTKIHQKHFGNIMHLCRGLYFYFIIFSMAFYSPLWTYAFLNGLLDPIDTYFIIHFHFTTMGL